MNRLSGKSVIVTGAAQGIGNGIAVACVNDGASVLFVDQNPAVEAIAAAVGAASLVVDVAADGAATLAVEKALAEFGRIDGLVNNAGRVDEADILETTRELWDDTINLNLRAPYLWIQAVIPQLLAVGGGSIVNVSSIEATHARPRHFPYIASKGGLTSMTRAIAMDFGRQGIRCNVISPGTVNTKMLEEYAAQYEGLVAHLESLNYAGRIGNIEEFGQAAVYLLSDETGFLNGHDLVIDGARTTST
jgi:NAD(P)-dependent dehydrogenase (short-subunit alcohol dehydrogenase family)